MKFLIVILSQISHLNSNIYDLVSPRLVIASMVGSGLEFSVFEDNDVFYAADSTSFIDFVTVLFKALTSFVVDCFFFNVDYVGLPLVVETGC